MAESRLNTLVQLGLSVLNQGGVSHLLGLGGPPRVAFGVVPSIGVLSTGSGKGCCLLGLGDCLGTGGRRWLQLGVLPQEESSVAGCVEVTEVFAPIGGSQSAFKLWWTIVQDDLTGREEVIMTSALLSNGLFL